MTAFEKYWDDPNRDVPLKPIEWTIACEEYSMQIAEAAFHAGRNAGYDEGRAGGLTEAQQIADDDYVHQIEPDGFHVYLRDIGEAIEGRKG